MPDKTNLLPKFHQDEHFGYWTMDSPDHIAWLKGEVSRLTAENKRLRKDALRHAR